MTQFVMPSLGADMEAGTLVEWQVKPGDKVARGDIVAVVETEKGAIEVEIFEDGRIDKLLVQPGTKVPVGTPLAVVLKPGETPTAPAESATSEKPPKAQAPKRAPIPAGPSPPPLGETRPRVSPAARRIAHERGVDIAGLKGSGPGGAIVSGDIPAAAKTAATGGLDLGEMRKAIAAAMARSKREIPHFYLQHTVDMTQGLDWLKRSNAAREPARRLLPAILFIKAVARSLQKYGEFNGHYLADGFHPSDAVHTGFAVAIRGGGLVAPAIRDTADLTPDDLMAKLKDLVARARVGRLRSSEISDPTITISSLGDRGVESLYGIIYPPQVALVGIGRIETRPAVIDDDIRPRPLVTLTLAADHRVADGHRGALFLADIGKRLQQPEDL